MTIQNHWRISHNQLVQYDIIRSHGIFEKANDILTREETNDGGRRFVVVDDQVYDLLSSKIHSYFKEKNLTAKIVPLQTGERNKSITNYITLLEALDAFPINRRNEPIIAIGGGVLTDLVGFVAGTYRRGIPHINVPTTIIGYVDAAIGIKTGVNFNKNKNRVGAFICPQRVILDKTFFTTLDNRHVLNGVGEIVKLAIIKDAELFTLLENDGKYCITSKFQDKKGDLILERAINGMLQELESNLFEHTLARSVDFGHTFSPILEMQDALNLLHGEAVTIDCILSSILAFNRKLLSQNELDRIFNLVLHLTLIANCEALQPDLLWKSLVDKTHHRDGVQRIPLPSSIGKHVFVNDITFEEINTACHFLTKWISLNCENRV